MMDWIKDPQSQKPGNKMPAFGENTQSPGKKLKDQEIKEIIKYLDALK
jgi:cytochrome c oxidase subunit 2